MLPSKKTKPGLGPNPVLKGSRWTKGITNGIFSRRVPWKSVCLLGFAGFIVWFFFFALPNNLFEKPYSTVVEDQHGQLVGARIAEDGQWRFPEIQTVPDKFKKTIVLYEDKRFDSHFGVDPLAVFRALLQNLKAGEIKSGASTLTMQVIRLSRGPKARTYFEKLVEAILAIRLEMRYSKQQILSMYASHAPFGGNVVGLGAAAWRYFGRSCDRLSWSETATLAVLPNAPSLIHPGRNRQALKLKRDDLLERMFQESIINRETYQLALLEPLPDQPLALPQNAPHLLAKALKEKPGTRLRTFLDRDMQRKALSILERYHTKLQTNDVHNGAILVVDNSKRQVLVYVGNCDNPYSGLNESAVDMVQAQRSTGSLLKPFLYAELMQQGLLLPQMLVRDTPIHFSGYSPKNFNQSYEGAVPADEALARSLNIPAVILQQRLGTERFLHLLHEIGFQSIDQPASYYGLALALGGAESSLLELTGRFSGMARTLLGYQQDPYWSEKNYYESPLIWETDADEISPQIKGQARQPLDPGAIWPVFEAMKMLNRPESQGLWRFFDSASPIAWKTGTSFGFRDAWAIGVTPAYTIGVWVGNADGEGRPGLTGISAAAPILFEVFRTLKKSPAWFERPSGQMTQIETCKLSGYRASPNCDQTCSTWIPSSAISTLSSYLKPCPFHQEIFLDPGGINRVTSACCSVQLMHKTNWFVLPPRMEWFYRQSHPSYQPLPPMAKDCQHGSDTLSSSMGLIYPDDHAQILIPIEQDGSPGQTVFEAVHRTPSKKIFWSMDDHFLGSTQYFHQIGLHPKAGKHQLVLVDEEGNRIEREFSILVEN